MAICAGAHVLKTTCWQLVPLIMRAISVGYVKATVRGDERLLAAVHSELVIGQNNGHRSGENKLRLGNDPAD